MKTKEGKGTGDVPQGKSHRKTGRVTIGVISEQGDSGEMPGGVSISSVKAGEESRKLLCVPSSSFLISQFSGLPPDRVFE